MLADKDKDSDEYEESDVYVLRYCRRGFEVVTHFKSGVEHGSIDFYCSGDYDIDRYGIQDVGDLIFKYNFSVSRGALEPINRGDCLSCYDSGCFPLTDRCILFQRCECTGSAGEICFYEKDKAIHLDDFLVQINTQSVRPITGSEDYFLICGDSTGVIVRLESLL